MLVTLSLVENKPALLGKVVIRIGSEVQIRYSGESTGIRYVLENVWKSVAKLPAKVRFHCCLDD